jgi:excinuclease ABC subunit A
LLIDLGPDGGDKGGQIVVTGTPETVAACDASWTGKYLAPLLAGAPAAVEAEVVTPVKRAR